MMRGAQILLILNAVKRTTTSISCYMDSNRKDAGSMWWLFYGKSEYKDDLLTVIMRLLKVHV